MSAALIINWIQSTLTWSAPLIICAMARSLPSAAA